MADKEYSFIHGADKTAIPTCRILGVDIAAIDMQWLLKYMQDNLERL